MHNITREELINKIGSIIKVEGFVLEYYKFNDGDIWPFKVRNVKGFAPADFPAFNTNVIQLEILAPSLQKFLRKCKLCQIN